jgi:tetratricopeptide (TPR) repeat protein
MIDLRLICALALSMAWLPNFAAASDPYWAFTYKDITVTGIGSADRAKSIAHNLHRLDLALGTVLGIQAEDWRAPTRVYAVPQPMFNMLWKKTDISYSSISFPSDSDNQILMNISLDRETPYFDAYSGYTGSLLASGYSSRYPFWFRKGLSEVFGASSVERKQVIIGGFVASRLRSLAGSWIPLRTLLNIADNDPQLQSADFLNRFSAECWFLVHQVVIEEKYHDNFRRYFSQLDQGDEESRAFAASFGTDYGNVDKEIQHALKAGVIKIIKVQVPDEPDSTEPRRLTDAEAKGRLAAFAALHGEDIGGAVTLANDALAADPKNEDALIALARTQLRQHLYPAALQYADRLCTLEPLSQNAAAQCAKIYADMLYGGAAKNAALGVDAPALAGRARKYFETAISADPEDLASWSGMTYLLTATHDVEYAKDFLPRAKHVWATHSRNEYLAHVLAGLCATTGDFDTAIKFATVWEKNALSESRRAEADAYLSRLKAAAERKAVSEARTKNSSAAAPMPTP